MRAIAVLLLAGAGAGALAGCVTGPVGGAPHLDKVVVETVAGRPGVFRPTFYFTDPDGDADQLHRRVVAIQGRLPNFSPLSDLDFAPDIQKRGAVLHGGWACDPEQISTTVRAYITDRHGNRSNSVDYTVVCR